MASNNFLNSSSGIRNNYRRGSVGDFLKQKVKPNSALSVVSAYFTIYAFEKLKDQLQTIERMRFLFGEPRFVRSLDPDKADKKAFKIEDEGLQLANRLEQKRVAKECADWIAAKCLVIDCAGWGAMMHLISKRHHYPTFFTVSV